MKISTYSMDRGGFNIFLQFCARAQGPRFTVSCQNKVAQVLRDLGLALLFDPVRADFGDMVESAPEPLVVLVGSLPRVLRRDERGGNRGRRGYAGAGGLRRRRPTTSSCF
jgi:hypothetical protein